MTSQPARTGGPAHRFLLSGMPKSGTTFIQMLLDSHPAINCPSESHLPTLRMLLKQVSAKYQSTLGYFDSVTARQGVRFDAERFVGQMLAGGIDALMRADAPWPTTHIGLKDNQVLQDLDLYRAFLPDLKYIFVVRDPRDIGLSLWHHKYRTEPAFAQKPDPKSAVIRSTCISWLDHMEQLSSAQSKLGDTVHVVRYESLLGGDRDKELLKMLHFLGVPCDDAISAEIWWATDFNTLRRREKRRLSGERDFGFFRKASVGEWREAFSADSDPELMARIANQLQKFE